MPGAGTGMGGMLGERGGGAEGVLGEGKGTLFCGEGTPKAGRLPVLPVLPTRSTALQGLESKERGNKPGGQGPQVFGLGASPASLSGGVGGVGTDEAERPDEPCAVAAGAKTSPYFQKSPKEQIYSQPLDASGALA